MAGPALRLERVSKQFGATRALDDVNLELGAGLIHSFLGANGSGKSTLIKILAGYHEPDDGARAWVRGEEASFPIQPASSGIAIVHQDLGLLEDATVLDNVGISSRYGAGRGGRISWRAERLRVHGILRRFGSGIPLDRPVCELQPADRTIVGIARALRLIDAEGVKDPILLLDEPTVTLPPLEVARLFGVMRDVAAAGGCVIFITHRLREALEISDRITVLRDGRVVESRSREGVEVHDLVAAMHGEASAAIIDRERTVREAPAAAAPVLEAAGLSGPNVEDFSLAVAPGEVVGVTGLAGMGQDELPYLLTGATTPRAGSVSIAGVQQPRLSPRSSWRQGVALVPANRAEQSMWSAGSLAENFTIVGLGDYFRGGRLERRREHKATRAAISRFAVRAGDTRAAMSTLSGGNQQKLVIGRAVERRPRVLLLHEPFIGIDAAARAAVLELIEDAAGAGCAVVVFSIEYELLAGACDRVMVMSHGRMAGELTADGLTETAIVRAAQEA